ncbi:MAG: hypothetical protein CME19_05335 [Gemmatimonadetes bacterium]|nr:hypothetical protein [Gemmatimonadota bacterium]|tara:strand:- start:5053 stop:5391 length:339 start_codon:yes stop_codon:yes gene_type:complete
MRPFLSEQDTEDSRTGQVSKAGPSIREVLEACGYTELIDEQSIPAMWPAVVAQHLGQEASENTEVIDIRKGHLNIRVQKAAWRHRLSIEVPELIKRLNEALGSDAVKSIRLK